MQHSLTSDRSVIEQIREIQPPGENLVAKIIELFLNESERLRLCLEQAVSASDWESVSKHAHSLKSCSANVGAMQVASLSHKLESACRDKRDDQVPALYMQLRSLLQSAVEELQSINESSDERDRDADWSVDPASRMDRTSMRCARPGQVLSRSSLRRPDRHRLQTMTRFERPMSISQQIRNTHSPEESLSAPAPV